MSTPPSVRVHNDLASRQTGITLGNDPITVNVEFYVVVYWFPWLPEDLQ